MQGLVLVFHVISPPENVVCYRRRRQEAARECRPTRMRRGQSTSENCSPTFRCTSSSFLLLFDLRLVSHCGSRLRLVWGRVSTRRTGDEKRNVAMLNPRGKSQLVDRWTTSSKTILLTSCLSFPSVFWYGRNNGIWLVSLQHQ